MKIMLDAGHGYSTPGKRSPDGMSEYEFTSAVANDVRNLLVNYQDVTVFFAHCDAYDVPLKERTKQANRLGIDVYISVHANAYGNGGWTSPGGIETYVYQTKPPIATQLAEKIQRLLIADTGLKDRGVKTANFHVLRETKMDAVLIECGFMTNRQESKLLRSQAYRKTVAKAIATALSTQYQLTYKPSVPTAKDQLYKVQVGAFKEKKHAETLARKLRHDGYPTYIDRT